MGGRGQAPAASEHPRLRSNRYRDRWCSAPSSSSIGEDARVSGWVHRRRDHGGLIFIDLRDRTGLLQLVFNPDESGAAHADAHRLRTEDVLTARGRIVARSEETVNPDLATGQVELVVEEFEVLADTETTPFEIEAHHGEVNEETRLRYRYLDLRRERMQEAIAARSRVTSSMRRFLEDEGFIEIETPTLTRSTPEGARDFLVPSRQQPGSFYALPQSPQLFKQLLMISGFERYFQIARCFRDEATRADRQAEFTQLDIEMSFIGIDEVIDVNERMLARVFEEAGGPSLELPLPRIAYDEAMRRYGSDRPDRRFGLELVELNGCLEQTEFRVFRGALDAGGLVIGINAGCRDVPRSVLDGYISRAQELGAKGLVWAFREGDGWRSPTAKFLTEAELSSLNEELGAEEGDLLLIVADKPAIARQVLGHMRLDLAEQFDLIPEGSSDMHWIVDWPLMEYDDEEGRWQALHHPFTSPDGDFDPDEPGEARALAYDLVWNGQELGGGSIRIHDPAMQAKVFRALGITEEEAEERFGFLLEALRFGAPPHGGIAFGLDRIVQRLLGTESIRDVIAFPKTATGLDLLTGAPAAVDSLQLKELALNPIKRP